jgi:hypothetical protein
MVHKTLENNFLPVYYRDTTKKCQVEERHRARYGIFARSGAFLRSF